MKNPLGCDGRRMLCSSSGSDEHFAKECHSLSLKEFNRGQLKSKSPVVHVLHDLATKMEYLNG